MQWLLLAGLELARAQLPAVVEAAVRAAVPSSITTPIIRSIGVAYDHRPYEPATPLMSSSPIGLDMGVEATVVKIDAEFLAALTNLAAATGGGSLGGLSALPAFIGAKLQVHKGIGPVDLGVSYLNYSGYLMYGGDVKLCIYEPTEGPTYAIRGKYSYTSLSIIAAQSGAVEGIVSRRLSFADPYIGAGAIYVWGNLTIPIDFLGTTYNVALNTVSATSFYAFGGLGLDFGGMGVRVAIEGAYSLAGNPHIGAKISLRL